MIIVILNKLLLGVPCWEVQKDLVQNRSLCLFYDLT